jgi:hypothetical protein
MDNTNPLEMKYHYLTIRVSYDQKKAFMVKAKDFGSSSKVLQEMVTAFMDDRISISPPPDFKMKSLYTGVSK